jgi:hypothetical protein
MVVMAHMSFVNGFVLIAASVAGTVITLADIGHQFRVIRLRIVAHQAAFDAVIAGWDVSHVRFFRGGLLLQ